MTTPHFLSRDEILAAQDLVTKEIEVPEWGGSVRVRSLTGTERDAFELSLIQGRVVDRNLNLRNMRAKLVAWATVDEGGQRLFSESDAAALGAKNAAALERVYKVAQRLAGLSEDDVEELVDGLGKDQSADSGSA